MIEENTPYTKDDLDKIGREWMERIRQSEKQEEDWIKAAKEAEAAYLCDDKAENASVPDFNILHSNVETIVPSIYNSTPRPEIRPRHNRDDKQAKFISDIHERVISALIDDNRLDREIEDSAQDTFMAGRGIVRVKLDADVEEVPVMGPDGMPLFDELGEPMVQERVSNERVIYENVSWRDYREGPAMRWRDVPWVAYAHEISDDERERLENPDYPREEEKKDPTFAKVWDSLTKPCLGDLVPRDVSGLFHCRGIEHRPEHHGRPAGARRLLSAGRACAAYHGNRQTDACVPLHGLQGAGGGTGHSNAPDQEDHVRPQGARHHCGRCVGAGVAGRGWRQRYCASAEHRKPRGDGRARQGNHVVAD